MAKIYDNTNHPPAGLAQQAATMPFPERVLMCPPDYFDVIDVKNPHMAQYVGTIDHERARKQWQQVGDMFRACGVDVETLEPLEGCEDMVFTANPSFVGTRSDGTPICLLGQMKYDTRQPEVSSHGKWFENQGYKIEPIPANIGFEGGGDAVWHPGRRLIWGAYGNRSDAAAFDSVAEVFDTPVIRLRLQTDNFYHLDTCFCAIDSETVLIQPSAFSSADVDLIRAQFSNVIEAPVDEANDCFTCNATALAGRHVVLNAGSTVTVERLRASGFEVHEVDTSEFLKSGGSVYCMKMYII